MGDIRTVHEMANLVRGRRIALGLSQENLARRANVSRKWVYEFEAGKQGAELRLVLAVLDSLGLRVGARVEDDGTTSISEIDTLIEGTSRE